ncbi:MAG: FG-GAP repeat protein [Sphingomonadaceae bacterium]|nr:FG-GAP repeat protein [Sphingomonadaceae bacterium]
MADFPAAIDLASLDGGNGFRLDGIDRYDASGRSVSSAGDVNGDGFDDIIIGASGAAPGGVGYTGQSYVVFGKAAGFTASLDLAALDGSDGFRIDGIDPSDQCGVSVSSAGDVNGDGFDDIVIGAYGGDPGGDTNAGESYVVFGHAGGFAPRLDLATLDGINGFRVEGIDAFDRSGYSVSSAGDVNGDGFDDIIIGAHGANPGGAAYAGRSYVVFGRPGEFAASLDLASLDGTNGFGIDGIAARDFSGWSVSAAGDVNGDGLDDITIGAFGGDPDGYSYAGESYIMFGKSGGFAADFDLVMLDGTNGFRLDGIDGFDRSGISVSSAGDVNGDGFDDIVIGADGAYRGSKHFAAGESYVVFGKAGGFAPRLDLARLDGTNGFRLEGIDRDDRSGGAVSAAGDVNGDGFDDIIVGADNGDPGGDSNAGESYVVFGHAEGFARRLDLATLDGANGFRIDGIDAGDFSGRSVSTAGDVDGDGFDDLLIGAYGGDPGGDTNAGESYVVFGRAPIIAVKRIGSDADQAIRGGELDDTLGGRGGDDLLVGGGGGDRLFGGFGTDTLKGGGGDDRLIVSTGRDAIKGNAGADVFALADALGSAERARINDYLSGTDVFEIDAADFGGGLAEGPLSSDAFRANLSGTAKDAEDRFIYDTDSGKLFYDADGTGAGEAVLLVRLSGAPAIDAGDFIIV